MCLITEGRLSKVTDYSMHSSSPAPSLRATEGGAGAYLQQFIGEKQGSTQRGCESITGQHRDIHPHTHKDNLKISVKLTVGFLDCWRKSEDL